MYRETDCGRRQLDHVNSSCQYTERVYVTCTHNYMDLNLKSVEPFPLELHGD